MRTVRITQPNWKLPFCRDVAGRPMELVCFHNECSEKAVIEIDKTILRFGVSALGNRYFVMAGDEFVIEYEELYLAGDFKRAIMFMGEQYTWGYKPSKESWFYRMDKDRKEFESGYLHVSASGRSWICGYPGPDLVYVRDEVGVFADGRLFVRQPARFPEEVRFIMGSDDGRFCITSDRKVFTPLSWKRQGPAWTPYVPVVDIREFYEGYLAMGSQGELFFSRNGLRWKRKNGLRVTAIAANDREAFVAKPGGTIVFGRYDRKAKTLKFYKELQTAAEHISSLAIQRDELCWQSAECNFDVLSRQEDGTYKGVWKPSQHREFGF